MQVIFDPKAEKIFDSLSDKEKSRAMSYMVVHIMRKKSRKISKKTIKTIEKRAKKYI